MSNKKTYIESDYEQLGFANNGCIKPCPYRKKCSTYNIGCNGGCYWCGKFENKVNREEK